MNEVLLEGKVSQVGRVEYTPSGVPLIEFTLAVPQEFLGRKGHGYCHLVASGTLTEDISILRVGARISVNGRLWQRGFRDRQGRRITEVKVIVNSYKIGGKQ